MDILISKLQERSWNYKTALYQPDFESHTSYKQAISKPFVSIIIICWQINPLLSDAIAALARQSCQAFELIFVDNGSLDSELDWVKPHCHHFIRLKRNTGAYLARNIGALFANTSILLFLEDDGIADQDLVKAHLRMHQLIPETVAIRGVYLPLLPENPANELPQHYYHGQTVFPLYSTLEGNSSYSAQPFFEAGGWDDQINFGHGGIDLALRLQAKGVKQTQQLYLPFAILRHDFAKSVNHLNIKQRKQEQGLDYIKAKHPGYVAELYKWHTADGIQQLRANLSEQHCSSLQVLYKEFEKVQYRHQDAISTYKHTRQLGLSPECYAELKLILAPLVVYGTGNKGKDFVKLCQHNQVSVSFFADSAKEKWGTSVADITVLPPKEIPDNSLIIIASQWDKEILVSLLKLGFKKEQIRTLCL